MTKLTRPQIEMLQLMCGTTAEKPWRRSWGQRIIQFPTQPTAMALYKRKLLCWRKFNGTMGGWFITNAGYAALGISASDSEGEVS